MNLRIGHGIDFHRLTEGRKLWLGGVLIPSEIGCIAHSDGDVLIHAICDAMLGALSLNDIGHWFPDSAEEFRNIRSTILLERTNNIIREKGYFVSNIDSTLCLEKPKIAPYISDMKRVMSDILKIPAESVSVKATTTEGLGFTGRSEGVVAHAVVLLQNNPPTS